ncbi:MAG: FAD-binding protein [Jatrophihabitans sp.]|uniref:FAD-binding protein n=1 Tax=Jatrophihabitans sp. TaxID=1932789 RepID=UPI003F7EF72E
MLTNWSGNVTFSTTTLHEPRTVEELQAVVAAQARLRVLGTGHSFSRIADSDAALVSVRGITGPVEFDDDAGTVDVPAGARYGDIVEQLHGHGRALHNLGSLPHISVAGAAATGTHGSGVGTPGLAAAVRGIELVRADGELVHLRAGDDDFAGAVVGLGALGVVTRLTLATQPTFAMRQQVWLDAPTTTVLEQFDTVMSSGYSVSLFIDPGPHDVIGRIFVKSLADAEPVDGAAWGARPATSPEHPLAGEDARAATPQLGEVRPWFEVLPHFRLSFTPSSGDEQQTEYFVDARDGAAALEAVLALDLDDALQVMEIRTIRRDDLWLSMAGGRDSFALHFTWHNRDEAVRRACLAVEEVLRPFAPRPHWGKVFFLDRDEVRSRYDRLPAFAALAARFDPDRTFGNDFLERYVY